MRCLTTLYSHQQRAVDKLRRPRVGGLFCEMGLGKTRMAIELVALRQQRIDHVLWFCPVSLKETIRQEILKHTDVIEREICVFSDRTNMRTVRPALWYIVGIESMSSSNRVVLTANSLITDKSYVIVDESSYIKGHRSMRTQRITYLSERARYRLILTGTPLSQGVVDLYAQMRFLSPAILGYHSFYSFAHNHLEYSDKYPGMIVRAHNVEHLAAKIQPYVYQVTKAECLDLPAKLYDVQYLFLTKKQQAAYQQAKEEILSLDQEIDSYIIFRVFTALQQIVAGFWNRRTETGEVEHLTFPQRRTEALQATIAGIPPECKVIIWCKYIYSINLICATLTAEHGAESVAQLHGGLSERQRTAEIERWRQSARFLVATQATGGHGLTLNEAHYVVFYENEFKYANRAQAEDRNHRIGQTERVTYVDIVAANSIDGRIMDALSKKANVVEAFRRQVEQVRDDKDQAALKALVMEL